ncbi:hypothetical protein [Streptomyces sp. NPDC002133]|uniref:hypothetical protein n=1 Tax=Streptomyces sp. NPDC002133 TaxID=3154409 RepID=UPI00331F8475
MRRRITRVVCAAAGAVLLTGCSPEQLSLVAVHVDEDGTPQVLLRPCDDAEVVRGPSLHVVPAGEEETDANRSGRHARGKRRVVDFPLFAPPPEWQAEVSGPQMLRPGHEYELTFGDPDDDYACNGTVTFRAKYLEALEPGEVWAAGQAMPREEFEDFTSFTC